MAYLSQDDPDLIDDLLLRKEFYWVKQWDTKRKRSPIDDIIPRFVLDAEIGKSGYLKLLGHQTFVENYLNPDTEYKRLHVKWSTGSGKTIAGLSVAFNFIKNYNLERELGNVSIGSVFIMGFSERAFKSELLRYPEFGFLSKEERIKLDKLKRIAAQGGKTDIDKYHEMATRIKKRFSNRKGNGFFRFFGYKAFVNRIFVTGPGVDISSLSEEQIRIALAAGKITYNEELLAEFKNSLLICDEIHNVYNSSEKNNWGIALQAVLDKEPTLRCLTLSATPLNNSPAEIVDLLNLLLPVEKRVSRSDFFINDKDLKPKALEKIAELSRGRFSFLIDVNPKYYPKVENYGVTLKEIPYLKFIRCPMSPFHYKTYKAVYTGALSQDSQYLVDFALPNPSTDSSIGIFQTNQIKKLIPTASQKWRDKYEIDYIDGKITGDILQRNNIAEYSTKYARMLDELFSDIKSHNGKIFIYHNVVHMSGVLFIEQLLIKNGFLDEFSSSSDNTICMKCGKPRHQHSKEEIYGAGVEIESYQPTMEPYQMESGRMETDPAQRTDDTESTPEQIVGGNVSDTKLGGKASIEYVPDMHPIGKPDVHPMDNSNWQYINIEDPAFIDEKVGGADVIELKTQLSKLPGSYSWDLDDTHLLSIYKKTNPNYYWIPTIHEKLLSAEPSIMAAFSNLLSGFSDMQLIVRIPNSIGKKLGDWMLQHGFVLATHDFTYSYLRLMPSNNVLGGRIKKLAKKIFKQKHAGHKFTPARFIMAHSDIDKAQMEHSIEKFNSQDNVEGDHYLILVGSKIIKESYDIKAIQNEYIMCKPDNIPTFIQIRGRAVRKGSHIGLPPEKQVVRMKIFTTCLPTKQDTGLDSGTYKLSYEEEKYKEKVASFQIIQKIEKVLHENAIDAIINYEKIQKHLGSDMLGPLPYHPVGLEKYNKERSIDELNLDTYNVFHAKKEVELCKILIKRLFIELSSIWEYYDLFHAVQNPPANYETELNTKLITEDNFIIALNQLVHNTDNKYIEPFIHHGEYEADHILGGTEIKNLSEHLSMLDVHGGSESNGIELTEDKSIAYADFDSNVLIVESDKVGGNQPIKDSVISHLFDSNDKIIEIPGGQDSIIVNISDEDKQFYILFPIDRQQNIPEIDIELPYRIVKQEEQKFINMNSFIQNKRIDFDYDDKKRIFYRKYADISIENMQNVVCEYGTTFHLKFIEECIEYVFKAWTDPNIQRSEFHEFYFKMLYYYDLMSLIMWAYTSKPRVFKEYVKYAIPVRAADIKLKALARYEKRADDEPLDVSPDDNSDLATSGVINLLKSTFNRTSNAWIPAEFREQYEKTVQKSLMLFQGRKKKSKYITKVSAEFLPIGHYISKFPRLYIPDKGWDENPTYLQNEQEFKENNLIVGFDERSEQGVHIRFKIRNPIHNIKKYKDSRQTEKGTVCKSKSKDYLKSIARKLGAELPDKVNVEDLCVVIRSKLIRLELKERIKKSNIKYFYFFYEQRPETRS